MKEHILTLYMNLSNMKGNNYDREVQKKYRKKVIITFTILGIIAVASIIATVIMMKKLF